MGTTLCTDCTSQGQSDTEIIDNISIPSQPVSTHLTSQTSNKECVEQRASSVSGTPAEGEVSAEGSTGQLLLDQSQTPTSGLPWNIGIWDSETSKKIWNSEISNMTVGQQATGTMSQAERIRLGADVAVCPVCGSEFKSDVALCDKCQYEGGALVDLGKPNVDLEGQWLLTATDDMADLLAEDGVGRVGRVSERVSSYGVGKVMYTIARCVGDQFRIDAYDGKWSAGAKKCTQLFFANSTDYDYIDAEQRLMCLHACWAEDKTILVCYPRRRDGQPIATKSVAYHMQDGYLIMTINSHNGLVVRRTFTKQG